MQICLYANMQAVYIIMLDVLTTIKNNHQNVDKKGTNDSCYCLFLLLNPALQMSFFKVDTLNLGRTLVWTTKFLVALGRTTKIL